MIRPLAALAISLALLLASGCHRTTRVAEAARTQTLYIAIHDDPADLDPHTNISQSTFNLLGSLFEGLVNLAGDGKTILPGVAESWTVSPDGLVYTFHLRGNARWSNGDPVTAQQFLVSFRRIFDPAIGAEMASFGFAIRGAKDFAVGRVKDPSTLGLSAPDDHTFVVALEHPAPYLLGLLGQGMFCPLHLPSVEKFGGLHRRGGAWTRPGNLISNGAFQLKSWVGNQAVVVERNPYYWDAAAVRLRTIQFIPTEDAATEERAFRAGQLHVTYTLPADKFAVYRQQHPNELHATPALRSDYLTFNVTRPPFDDARVRRAFSLAIDRDKLISAVLPGLAEPLHGLTRDGTGGFTPPPSEATKRDVAEAQRLLANAGYADRSRLPPIELMLQQNQGYILRVGEVLQEMWAHELGVRVSVMPTEFKVYLEAERTKKFQVLTDDWVYSFDDPIDPLQCGQSANPNNDSGWSNAEYDQLYRQAEYTASASERQQTYAALESILAREVPYAPLYSYSNVRLVHPTVRGWTDNALNWIDFRALWLSDER